jgi:hypothetical protein
LPARLPGRKCRCTRIRLRSYFQKDEGSTE